MAQDNYNSRRVLLVAKSIISQLLSLQLQCHTKLKQPSYRPAKLKVNQLFHSYACGNCGMDELLTVYTILQYKV